MTFSETMVAGGLILSLAIIVPITIIAVHHWRHLRKIKARIKQFEEDWDRRDREEGLT